MRNPLILSTGPVDPSSPEFFQLQTAVAGRYSLDRELGRGGMGIVFLARDVALERLVAIKLLPPALAGAPGLRDRFLREARTAAGLSHPHIVPIHAVEDTGGLVFFVMAHVDGESLGQAVRRSGPLPAREVMRIVQEVAWALGHAHARGVIHRDVKPDNILLERGTGRALVTDFGIARVATAGDTPAGGIVGTPQYMAPEQAAGGVVDGRSDLYALGVTAFFALTGRLPFEAPDAAALLVQHAGVAPPPVLSLAPRTDARFARMVDGLLQKDPALRPPSAEHLAEAVRAARGQFADAVPPVRAFLRDTESAGGEMAFLLGIGGGALVIHRLFFHDSLFSGMVFYPIAALMVGLAGARLGQAFGRVRDLVRQGFRHPQVRPAILQEQERKVEEQAMAPTARRGILRDSALALTVGTAKTAAFVWLAQADGPVWLNFLGAAGAIMVPAAALRRLWGQVRRGRPGIWLRWLAGGFGRRLFSAAGLGLSTPGAPAPSGEPTEIALAGELADLYRRLPATWQARFRDLPALVDRLQGDAALLRERQDGRGHELREAVAALESLRLDLLRLHAGAAVQEELTRDLADARRIGDLIDAALRERGDPSPTSPA